MINNYKNFDKSRIKIWDCITLIYNDKQKDKRYSSPKYCLSKIIAYANIAGYEISVFVRYENDYIL